MPISTFCTRAVTLLLLVSLIGCAHHSRHESSPPAESGANTVDDGVALYQQAITLLNNDKPEQAEPILQQLSVKHPEFAGPWANLGLIQLNREKFDEAEKLFKNALERDPKLSQALNLLGVVEMKRGDFQYAEQLYSQAIAAKEDYAIAHYNLALLYDIYFQDPAKALPHYERYLELTGNQDQNTANWVEELKSELNRASS